MILDFLRYRDAVIEGGEHQESSGKSDFGGQSRPFGGNGLFGDLHEQFLTLGEHVADSAVFVGLRLILDFADAGRPLVRISAYRLDVLRKSVEL